MDAKEYLTEVVDDCEQKIKRTEQNIKLIQATEEADGPPYNWRLHNQRRIEMYELDFARRLLKELEARR